MRNDSIGMLSYFTEMIHCHKALSEAERAALQTWEREHIGGSFGTSDWPGWEKYIGPKPITGADKKSREGYVYLVEAGEGLYKIGAATDVEARIAQLQTGNPHEIQLRHCFPALNALNAERELHARFSEKRWRSEWFRLTLEDVELIRAIERG